MVAKYKAGDRVEYHPVGGGDSNTSTSVGEIVDVLTETQPAGDTGITAQASAKEPRYLIRNENTGKESAYKAGNIVGKA